MTHLGSNKKIVQSVIDTCCAYGVNHAVISPGSRNAPLIISFASHPAFKCYSIPDERSAAFYALGLARQMNRPVALICTSGTAVLNYAPAITEAFYQEVPLIAITADRPPEVIDQEDGQTIRQKNIFGNHIRYSANLDDDDNYRSVERNNKILGLALSEALKIPPGPVHINVPLIEPLYNTCRHNTQQKSIEIQEMHPLLSNNQKQRVLEVWKKSSKIIVLFGVNLPGKKLSEPLNKLAQHKNVVVISPPTANINGKNIFTIPEIVFLSIGDNDANTFKPDLLITLGGPVVSKATKQFLRKHKPNHHFDIDLNPRKIDTYQCLTDALNVESGCFLDFIIRYAPVKSVDFASVWKRKAEQANKILNQFSSHAGWSDISVFHNFFRLINQNIDLHLANSTPVRYAELFEKHPLINYYCNRGTSGIDGSTSTAAGAASASGKTTVLLTGDMSFIYDSNAFWNRHIPPNLKIIVINNGGGNIFKVIQGPSATAQIDDFFVTRQTAHINKVCETFGIKYLEAKNRAQFAENLQILLKTDTCSVLEVKTKPDESAENFKKLIAVLNGKTWQ